MKNIILFFLLCFFVFIGLPVSLSLAQEEEAHNSEVMALRQEVGELRALIEEQKKIHAMQMESMQKQLDALSDYQTGPDVISDDMASLRRAAENEASRQQILEKVPEETTFQSGGLSLQSLNPEISLTGDFITTYASGDETAQDFDFNFRGLGIHFESYLDPYSKIKAAVPISTEGAELGEAYFTRYGIMEDFNLTLGKFRQQFGVVNRWHKHALDWVDFPLPLRMIFGAGGLNQTGFSLDWTGMIGDASQELIFQMTDGENGCVFAQNAAHKPSLLFHYKNYRDLTDDMYLEFGLTGLTGWNDEWAVFGAETINNTRSAWVYGADLTFFWEPADRMRYRNFEWRTEAYYLDKGIWAPDGSGKDDLRAWGAYSSVQAKVSRTIDIGFRLDYYEPDTKDYAGLTDLSLYPWAVTDGNAHRWLTVVFATWHQSPFVKLRLEYDYENGNAMGASEQRIMLQAIVAAGPHKHERY